MTYAPRYRIAPSDTTSALEMAASIIDHSGVVELLQSTKAEEGATDTPRRGRPVTLARYTVRAVLITMFEIMWAGDTLSWVNVTDRLWCVYNVEQMEIIGLANWRDPVRANAFRAANPHGTAEARQAATTAWHNEVKRLTAFADTAFAAIDDTPLPANRRQEKVLWEATKGSTDELLAASALQRDVINKIVFGSLMHYNANRHSNVPPEHVHAGFLADHLHDVGIDEHEVAVTLGSAGRRSTKPHKQLAALHAHVRREKTAEAIGLTAAIAVSRPDRVQVPNVALGIAIHAPGSADTAGTLDSLSAIERNGMRPEPRGTQRHYVVADMGYTAASRLNERLIERKYSMVMTYPENWKTYFDLSPTPTENQPPTTGPYLFNGRCICPGIGKATLVEIGKFTTPDERTMTGEQLNAHAPTERLLESLTMPWNGRPQKAKRASRGRPRVGQPELEGVYKQQVVCPAVDGKVRCPIIVESMNNQAALTVPHPPPEGARPPVCQTSTSTVTLDARHIKQWQHKLAGTWDHADLYSPARSRTEQFFSQLIRDETGNLSLGTIAFHKNGPVALAIAMAVAATNIHILQQWDTRVDNNGGNAPRETGAKRKRLRAGLMAQDARKARTPRIAS